MYELIIESLHFDVVFYTCMENSYEMIDSVFENLKLHFFLAKSSTLLTLNRLLRQNMFVCNLGAVDNR